MAFLIASGTPLAFPKPIPTFPFSSPTAANTENEILLPPLTVLETLLILKSLSLSVISISSQNKSSLSLEF